MQKRLQKDPNFAENKPPEMVLNTSGWIVVASRNLAILSFRRRSTRCTAGTAVPQGAMYIYQMFRSVKMMAILPNLRGIELSEPADGSLEAGLFKSFSLRV